VCNICRKFINGDIRTTEHYCERCLPFAERYREEFARIMQESNRILERKIETARNDFLREIVLKDKKPVLEAVK